VVLNTDEYRIYQGIMEEIEAVKGHRVVDHRPGEWAKGEAHGNGCENRNGFLRTFLRKHRGVSKGYLQGYLDFLSLLLNERGR
jgi:IS1 family transposase